MDEHGLPKRRPGRGFLLVCAVVAVVLVAASLIAFRYFGERQALERVATSLGQANACLYGGPLDSESRSARLLSIELCEKKLHSRGGWPTQCLEPFRHVRSALEEAGLADEEKYRQLHALAEPALDDPAWPDAFAEAALAAGIAELPAPASPWCKAPPLFVSGSVEPLLRGAVRSVEFETRGAGLGIVLQTSQPAEQFHACALRDSPDGPVGRCRSLVTKLERPRSVVSEDPTVLAVHDRGSRRLVVAGDPENVLDQVDDVAGFTRDGRLLEIVGTAVRVTRGKSRGPLVPWPKLERADGEWYLFGELVVWLERDKAKSEQVLWAEHVAADGIASGDGSEVVRQPGFLTLTLGGDVASCALDPERRVVAVVGGPEKSKTHVTLFAVERERITKWGELEISGARAHLVDHPTLGCERGAAVLAWNAGDQVHTARCTQRGCESQQGKAKLDTLRPLAAAGSTVVLVDTILDATRGAPIVLRAGPVASVDNGPARVLAVDASRGGPLAPGHELHVASTGGAVWIVSAPRRELGPLIAFRVDAGGRIAAVRPERAAR